MPIRPSLAVLSGAARRLPALLLLGASLVVVAPSAQAQTMPMPMSADTTGQMPMSADTTGQMAMPMSADTTGKMMPNAAMPMGSGQPMMMQQKMLGGNAMGTGLAIDSLDVDEFVRVTTDPRIDLVAAMTRGSVNGGTPIAQPGVQMRLAIPAGWVSSGRAFQSDSVTIVAYRSPQSAAVSEQYKVPPPIIALTQQARRMDRPRGGASMAMSGVAMSDSMRKAIEALSGLPNPDRANQPLPRDVPRMEVTASMTKAAHDSVRLWAVVQETLSFGPNQLPLDHQTPSAAQLSMLGLDQAYLARYRQSRGAYEVQLNALFGKRGDQQYVVMVENPAEVTLTPAEVEQVHQILASFRP